MITKSKGKTPKWALVLIGVMGIGTAALITIWMIKPSNKQADLPSTSPVETAETQWAKERAGYLQLFMTVDVDPKVPRNFGILQSWAMQRSLEILDYANAQRVDPKSPSYRLPLETITYQLQQANNNRMVNAQRGQVNYVETYTTAEGGQVKIVPTATSVLGKALLDELALNFISTQIAAKVSEADMRNMLNKQTKVSDSLALLLDQKNQGDTLESLDKAKREKLTKGGGQP